MEPPKTITTSCCIAGGGPAGIMLAFLLARAGVDVVVLEKYPDFFRDFRGDTIHPSTLELMYELGLLDAFLAEPHQEVRTLAGQIGGERVVMADLSHLPTHCKFLALMPQWDFLNFLARKAQAYPTFHLHTQTEVTDLLRDGGRITGAVATTPAGRLEVRAGLVVAADGRHSTVRERAGLELLDFGAPMDVLWFRLARVPDDPSQVLGIVNDGKFLVMLDRGDYWQCGFLIRKGAFDAIRARGLEAFGQDILSVAPFFGDRVRALADWNDVKLLTVRIDRLRTWYRAGLLCIGDAAHAMSPIGGVGINLAVQDAVAAANLLWQPLAAADVSEEALRKVQERREWATRLTQRGQVLIQNNVIDRVLGVPGELSPPWILKLLDRFPILRRIPGRLIGIGFRPEHIRTPERLPRPFGATSA